LIVVDASAVVDAISGNSALLARLEGEEMHGPHLLDIEVASALRRLVAGGSINDAQAGRGLSVLVKSDIHRHGHVELLPAIWALRKTLTPNDATYVALAAALKAPLVTTDHKLASAPGLPCTVEAF
jgi:predicted nucleic acid-binding protein